MSPSCSLSFFPPVLKVCHLPLRQNMVSCLSHCVLVFAGKCVKSFAAHCPHTAQRPSRSSRPPLVPPEHKHSHRFIGTICNPLPRFHPRIHTHTVATCQLMRPGKMLPNLNILLPFHRTDTIPGQRTERWRDCGRERLTQLGRPPPFLSLSFSLHPQLQHCRALIVLNLSVSSSAVAGFWHTQS